ncbi:MAG: carbamate kinase [Methanomicrobiales archaeon]|nr:carbamate kinase [Methanomicrobiales archaeon]
MPCRKVLVALGGNAILKHREKGTKEEQFRHVRETSRQLVELVRNDCHIAITHGNGPQVGDILLRNELAKNVLPPMTLDVCGAESQGMIGYMIQQSLRSELDTHGLNAPVVTLLTQVVVDPNDPAFAAPSKPIGPFYTALEASRLRTEKGWVAENDSGRGYRRMVPSPRPIQILEEEVIRTLYSAGVIIIAAGGGGVPVIRSPDQEITGIEAVIDKDHTAALLARIINAEVLLILTDVEKVALNYDRPSQENLDRLTRADAMRYLAEGHFPHGSMGPKIEAAIEFLDSGGSAAIITTPSRALAALRGEGGTVIVP